jgi:hypothetical protein
VLLLGFAPGREAEEALASALADRDPSVARAAALALSGRPSASAQGTLARALDHREPAVRRTAAQAVSRWAGEPLDAAAPSGERRRAARRIAEKLATVDAGALREAVVAAAVLPARAGTQAVGAGPFSPALGRQAPPGRPAIETEGAIHEQIAVTTAAIPALTSPPTATRTSAAGTLTQARTAVAVADAAVFGSIEESVVAEVRAALRGRTAEDLVSLIPAEPAAVEAALAALVARGTLARRGTRFFGS